MAEEEKARRQAGLEWSEVGEGGKGVGSMALSGWWVCLDCVEATLSSSDWPSCLGATCVLYSRAGA